jgi:hypothetical protein
MSIIYIPCCKPDMNKELLTIVNNVENVTETKNKASGNRSEFVVIKQQTELHNTA